MVCRKKFVALLSKVCDVQRSAKSPSTIEAVVSLEVMSKKNPSLSVRRRLKRRDHAQDDILNCPSLKDVDFYAEPLPDDSDQDVSPYKTEIDATSPLSSTDRVEWEEDGYSSNGGGLGRLQRQAQQPSVMDAAETTMGEGGGERGEIMESEQPISTQTSARNNWNLMQKWKNGFYDSSNLTTTANQNSNCSMKTTNKRKAKKLRPSPLAQNVGNVLENFGRVAADFFIHLCHLTGKAVSYQGPIVVLLIITCLYYSIMYLEVSLANSAEILLEWFWPFVHLSLRGLERLLRSATNFVQGLDELGESIVCDWAQLWCAQFDLMCHQRCSFTSKTLERLRYSAA